MILADNQSVTNTMNTLAESMPSGIIIVDKTGKIIFCNSELERMFGYKHEELLTQSVDVLVPILQQKQHPKMRIQYNDKPLKRQMGSGRDLNGLRKDGNEFPVEIGLNPIKLQEGACILATVVDITQRKGIEHDLRQAYQELKQKNEEMEQFVYSISHDLKAPLVTSNSFISFLREDLNAKNYNEVMDSLSRLEGANKRMQESINDLLEFSRIGRVNLDLKPTDLKLLINDIIENNIEIINNMNINIEVPSDLPTVFVDYNRFTQVFENLITNAIKYACLDNSPRISILWCETDDEIQICVKDYGPGIDPQYHKKIFGLFQRLSSDKQGTGIGLTAVARILQLHSGRVWVNSEVGAGAEFWIGLPKNKNREHL
jgi:PAS domain S-box-containing protein